MAWNQEFFRAFWPRVAPAVTAHRGADTRTEVRALVRLLRLRREARILDVPCGYGRHAIELARRGFRVTGLDISRELLRQARQVAEAAGVHVEFRRGDMRRLRYRNQFDAVLNLFTSFGYFGDAGDWEALRKFRRALRPRGWLILQLINRDWVLRHFRPRQRVRMGQFVLTEKGSFDFATSVITTEWTARRGRRVWRGTTRLRLYSCHELLRMLRQAGFETVKCFGDRQGGPLRLDSRWQVLLARR